MILLISPITLYSQKENQDESRGVIRRNGFAMTTGLSAFSLVDDGFTGNSSNASGENGILYRRDLGKIWYIQTEVNFLRRFSGIPAYDHIRVAEQIIQIPIALFLGNPHNYNKGAINYAFGVGVYGSKPLKQTFTEKEKLPLPSILNLDNRYSKIGFLFDTSLLLNATERAMINLGFRSNFDRYAVKAKFPDQGYLFRSYTIYLGSAFRW